MLATLIGFDVVPGAADAPPLTDKIGVAVLVACNSASFAFKSLVKAFSLSAWFALTASFLAFSSAARASCARDSARVLASSSCFFSCSSSCDKG